MLKTRTIMFRLLPFVLLTLWIFASCSGSTPSLESVDWRILLRDDGNFRGEELYVYFRASDADGSEDLSRVTVRAGESGLLWSFDAGEWIPDAGGESGWWGLPPMRPADGSRIPDGLYTVELEDLSGALDTLSFRPDSRRTTIEEAQWPRAGLENGFVKLDAGFSPATLILRSPDGQVVSYLPVTDGTEVDMSKADTWELWIPLENVRSGYRLGPYRLD